MYKLVAIGPRNLKCLCVLEHYSGGRIDTIYPPFPKLGHAMACKGMPCRAMPWRAMPCHAMAWHAMEPFLLEVPLKGLPCSVGYKLCLQIVCKFE